MSVIDRLSLIMRHYRLNQNELAKKMGAAPPNVSMIMSGRSLPAFKTLSTLLFSLPELSADWLINGTGDMLKAKATGCINLPVCGEIAAGDPLEIIESESLDYVPVDTTKLGDPDSLICFRINGDSMLPFIMHQDVVVIKRMYSWDQLNNTYAAVQIDGQNTLKQVIIDHSAQHLILMPINTRKHLPLIFDPESPQNITILGTLRLIIRQV